MNRFQVIISFITFATLFYLMTDANNTNKIKNKNKIEDESDINFDKDLSTKVGKNDMTAVKISFFLFLIGIIYMFYQEDIF